MNKKLIISLAMVGAIAVIAIGATTSYFSNTETSSGNTFIAGAIDLKVDSECHYNGRKCISVGDYVYRWEGTDELCYCTWEKTDLKDELFFNFTDVKPGDSGEDTISLHVDTNPAWICAEISNVMNTENGCNPPEAKVDNPETSCGDPGEGQGELQDNLYFSVWMDPDCDNIYDEGEETYIIQNARVTDVKWPIADSTTQMGPIQDACIGVAWYVPSVVDNIIQGDSVKGDITFNAYQARNNDNFVCYPSDGCFDQADVMLVLDRSGSIDTTERAQLKAAAHAFVTALNPDGGVHMGQSSFADTGSLDLGLTGDQAAIHAAIDALGGGTYTNLYEGLDYANDELDNSNTPPERPSVQDYMVVITDGNPNRPTPDATARQMAADEANAARAAGVEIYVVGVGSDVDATYLINNIADDPAHYFSVANYGELEALLQAIATCQNPPSVIGSLTVIKQVINDNSGTKQVSDFSLFVSGYQVTSGVAINFPAGSYTVTETGNDGYVGTFSGDCDAQGNVTLAPEDNKVCTLINDDNAITQIFSDNFNDGNYDGWTAGCFESGGSGSQSCSSPQFDVSTVTGGNAYDGYSVRMEDDAGIYRTISTTGKTNIQLKYCRRTEALESGDYMRIGWKTGGGSTSWGNYSQLETVQNNTWNCVSWNLPSSANNTNITIGMYIDNGEGDFGWVDNIEVWGL